MSRLLRAVLLLSCLLPATVEGIAPVEVTLLTGNPGGLVEPGRENELALVISNTSAQGVDGVLRATVTEFDGTKLQLDGPLKLPPRGKVQLGVPLGTRHFGIRTIDYKVVANGEVAGRHSFVYGQAAGAAHDPSGFLWGVSAHLEQDSKQDAERQLAAVSQIGVGVLRMGEEWGWIELEPGMFRWAKLDERVAQAERHGLQVQMLLAYGHERAAGPAARAAMARAKADGEPEPFLKAVRAAPNDVAWRSYVRAAVTHYRGRVKLWEIWNEPDLSNFFLGSTDEYIRMLRSAYQEVKRLDPEAQVMTAGFATVHQHDWKKLNPNLQQRVLAEASDAFDIHAVHEHGEFAGFVKAVDGDLARFRGAMKKSRPLYFNETAASSRLGREREQAVTLVKKIVFARARGAVGFTWYDLRNDGNDPEDYEHNFGLLTRALEPKPAYAAYNELIKQLRGARFTRALALGAEQHGYVFDAPGRKVAVLWSEGAARDLAVALTAPGASAAQRVDMMGNASALPISNHEVVVQLHADPVYVEFLSMKRAAGPAPGSSLEAPLARPRARFATQ